MTRTTRRSLFRRCAGLLGAVSAAVFVPVDALARLGPPTKTRFLAAGEIQSSTQGYALDVTGENSVAGGVWCGHPIPDDYLATVQPVVSLGPDRLQIGPASPSTSFITVDPVNGFQVHPSIDNTPIGRIKPRFLSLVTAQPLPVEPGDVLTLAPHLDEPEGEPA